MTKADAKKELESYGVFVPEDWTMKRITEMLDDFKVRGDLFVEEEYEDDPGIPGGGGHE